MKSRLMMMIGMAALLTLGSGCVVVVVGAAAGAGAYVWSNGELRSTEGVPFDKAWEATLAGMADLQYTVTEQKKDVVEAKLTAQGAGTQKIHVTIEKTSGTLTEIRVRVGTFGDKKLSQAILEKIKSHF